MLTRYKTETPVKPPHLIVQSLNWAFSGVTVVKEWCHLCCQVCRDVHYMNLKPLE